MTILILEPEDYSLHALKIYKLLGPVYLWANSNQSEKKSADILVIGLKYQIDKIFLDQMPKLKIIALPATGVNHIDVDYVKSKKIKIISLRGQKGFLKNVPSTAEETMALLFSLVRNIPWAFDDVKNGNWDRLAWRGHQLMGKTIGLLGFGRLGRIVARYAKAFGMQVISCDPNVSEKFMKSRGAVKVSMDELFKKSDIISLHVLLTDETQNLVKEKHLKSMKPSAYLINTARAELIEKNSLYNALKNKWIAGAGLDVMWDERSDGSHLKKDPLWKYSQENKNLIILPHIGGATYEAMEDTQEFIAGLVEEYINGRRNLRKSPRQHND